MNIIKMNQKFNPRNNKKTYNLPGNRELKIDMDKRQYLMAKSTREAVRILIKKHRQEFNNLVEKKFKEKIR